MKTERKLIITADTKFAELSDEMLENVSGGRYDMNDPNQKLIKIRDDGSELLYSGTDTCPYCGRKKKSVFYQNGSLFACHLCAFGFEYGEEPV